MGWGGERERERGREKESGGRRGGLLDSVTGHVRQDRRESTSTTMRSNSLEIRPEADQGSSRNVRAEESA